MHHIRSGVAAAIISHPADTLLSMINKGGAGGEGSMSALPRLTVFVRSLEQIPGRFKRMGNIVAETGIIKLCTQGLGARCVMIGTLTAGQFGIFDIIMNAVRRPLSPLQVPFKLALPRLVLPSSISTIPTTTTNLAIGHAPTHPAH